MNAPIPIHHITNIDNLPRIIKTGGLWCDAERIRQGFDCVSIGYDHLKQRRMRKRVQDQAGRRVAAGGVLADYVPFYFANRSPMLYSIHQGQVIGYAGGQANVVYLVGTVETVVAGNRPWFFTDGHAVQAMTEFFANSEHLDKIDWNVIRSRSWKDRENDPDRKRRKQAEFLIHGSVPWSWICSIGVVDQGRSQRVKEMIAEASHQPEVSIERSWYYN